LNAANEIAVARFLNDEVSFTGMTGILEHALATVSWQKKPDLEALIASDAEARAVAREFKA
jgi:1-deoxy-D-xylulose-5-phosphate reductoisomerase